MTTQHDGPPVEAEDRGMIDPASIRLLPHTPMEIIPMPQVIFRCGYCNFSARTFEDKALLELHDTHTCDVPVVPKVSVVRWHESLFDFLTKLAVITAVCAVLFVIFGWTPWGS